MSIVRAIDKAFMDKEKRGWDKLYFFIDIHGTILKANYEYGNTDMEFYPYAKEVLQRLSKKQDVIMVLYTCSHPHEIEEYVKMFEKNNIHFDYINENPEVKTDTNGYGCYDKKPYFNVLMDDKAGFDPLKDWDLIFNYINKINK